MQAAQTGQGMRLLLPNPVRAAPVGASSNCKQTAGPRLQSQVPHVLNINLSVFAYVVAKLAVTVKQPALSGGKQWPSLMHLTGGTVR